VHYELIHKKYDDTLITFLNSSAKSFYLDEHTFEDPVFSDLLKANILSAMIDIERTVKGTFGCDLSLSNISVEKIKQMFPNACQEIFYINDYQSVTFLGSMLNSVRNMNAHARIFTDDLFIFNHDFSFLKNHKIYHNEISYFNSELTIAGYIYIILNFLREKSISTLSKSDLIFSLISEGEYIFSNGEKFVSQISKVNLEIAIRELWGNDIFDATVGDYKELITIEDDTYQVKIGPVNNSSFSVGFTIKEDTVLIKKNSLSRVYYDDDYQLIIEDINLYIYLSNQLPSFAFIDFLYKKKISRLNNYIFNEIKEEFEKILKLNYPKFYIDKNLDVLLLPDSKADFRLISSIFVNGISKFIISIESLVYKENNLKLDESYSTIDNALKSIHMDNHLKANVRHLRNFVTHGYILDEYMIGYNNRKQFTIKYSLLVLRDLLKYFKNNYGNLYDKIKFYFKEFFIGTIISAKYKKIIEYSIKIIEQYPKFNKEQLKLKHGFLNNSVISLDDFDEFIKDYLLSNKPILLKVNIIGIDDALYLWNNENDQEQLKAFCFKFNFKIIDKHEDSNSLTKYISIEK